MQSLVESIVGAVLLVWFVLSVVAQRPWPGLRRVTRFDVLQLVTQYGFFAPDPTITEARAESRILSGNGLVPKWQPVWTFRQRTLLGGLWNPERRGDYAFAKDCLRVVALFKKGENPDTIETTRPFRRVLNVVRHRISPRAACGDQFEFRLVSVTRLADGSEVEEPVVTSGPRSLD